MKKTVFTGCLKDAPNQVLLKIAERQLEQRGTIELEVFDNFPTAPLAEGGFDFINTPEGRDWWRVVLDGENGLETFYKKYPKGEEDRSLISYKENFQAWVKEFKIKVLDKAPEGVELKVGDIVSFTNQQGVVFYNREVLGFAPPTHELYQYGNMVYLNSDSYWMPKKIQLLEIQFGYKRC